MDSQTDLFGTPLGDLPGADPPETELRPLAAPCGFRDRSNRPCRRLAVHPILCNGAPLRAQGRILLHCTMECFDAAPDVAKSPDMESPDV